MDPDPKSGTDFFPIKPGPECFLIGAAWGLEKPIISVVTDPEVFTKIPVALTKARLVDIKDLENPEVINQILERYEKEIATAHNNA